MKDARCVAPCPSAPGTAPPRPTRHHCRRHASSLMSGDASNFMKACAQPRPPTTSTLPSSRMHMERAGWRWAYLGNFAGENVRSATQHVFTHGQCSQWVAGIGRRGHNRHRRHKKGPRSPHRRFEDIGGGGEPNGGAGSLAAAKASATARRPKRGRSDSNGYGDRLAQSRKPNPTPQRTGALRHAVGGARPLVSGGGAN